MAVWHWLRDYKLIIKHDLTFTSVKMNQDTIGHFVKNLSFIILTDRQWQVKMLFFTFNV